MWFVSMAFLFPLSYCYVYLLNCCFWSIILLFVLCTCDCCDKINSCSLNCVMNTCAMSVKKLSHILCFCRQWRHQVLSKLKRSQRARKLRFRRLQTHLKRDPFQWQVMPQFPRRGNVETEMMKMRRLEVWSCWSENVWEWNEYRCGSLQDWREWFSSTVKALHVGRWRRWCNHTLVS